MDCKELVYLLGDYIDGTMDARLREEFALHLAKCEPCINFLKTYDKTRLISRTMEPAEIPEEVRSRIRSFVMEKAREQSPGIRKYFEHAAEERHRQVVSLIDSFRRKELSAGVASLFGGHIARCPKCGAFLDSLNGEETTESIPAEVEEHIASFIESLPVGEGFPRH